MTTARGRETSGVAWASSAGQTARGTGAALFLRRRLLLLLAFALLILLVLSLFVGRYPAPYAMPPSALWQDDMARQLVLRLRLPRVLTACLMGMTLAASGTVLQMIFRNPLVEPGLLGVSQGAAFGAAASIIVLSAGPLAMEGVATLFACLGLALSYLLARRIRKRFEELYVRVRHSPHSSMPTYRYIYLLLYEVYRSTQIVSRVF